MMSPKKIAYLLSLVAALGIGAVHAGELVVIGNTGASALTKDQVSDIYQGKSQAFTPVDLPESAAARADFYKEIAGKDLAQMKTLWAKLAFTGKAQPPKEMADAAAVKKAVAADPKAIGYIDKSAVDGSVKVVHSFE